MADPEIAIALEAPPTAQEVTALGAQEQAARATETDILQGPIEEGQTDTRFKLGDAVPNPIDATVFNARVNDQRQKLRGERINLRTFDTFDQYLADLATQYDETTNEDAVRRYIAAVPRFAGQFTQKANGAEVTLIREAIADEAALERVLSHEIVGHYRMADLLGPAVYSRARTMIQTATKRSDPELYAMRRKVEREMVKAWKTGNGFSEAEAQRLLKTEVYVEAVADEVVGELAEKLVSGAKLGRSEERWVSVVQDGLDAAGLPTRNAGTRWVGKMLQTSRDTTTGDQNRGVVDMRNARARATIEQRDAKKNSPVLDETRMQALYRLNYRDYLGPNNDGVGGRVHALILNQMESENPAYNNYRTQLREAIIAGGDGASYTSDLRQFAEANDVRDVMEALDPGSPAWKNKTGYTFAEMKRFMDDKTGAMFDKMAADTEVGGQRLDDSLDNPPPGPATTSSAPLKDPPRRPRCTRLCCCTPRSSTWRTAWRPSGFTAPCVTRCWKPRPLRRTAMARRTSGGSARSSTTWT